MDMDEAEIAAVMPAPEEHEMFLDHELSGHLEEESWFPEFVVIFLIICTLSCLVNYFDWHGWIYETIYAAPCATVGNVVQQICWGESAYKPFYVEQVDEEQPAVEPPAAEPPAAEPPAEEPPATTPPKGGRLGRAVTRLSLLGVASGAGTSPPKVMDSDSRRTPKSAGGGILSRRMGNMLHSSQKRWAPPPRTGSVAEMVAKVIEASPPAAAEESSSSGSSKPASFKKVAGSIKATGSFKALIKATEEQPATRSTSSPEGVAEHSPPKQQVVKGPRVGVSFKEKPAGVGLKLKESLESVIE